MSKIFDFRKKRSKPTGTEKDRFGRDITVKGVSVEQYLADLAEQNDKAEIEIERGKLACAVMKQLNNRLRFLLDAAKFELKERETRFTEPQEKALV